MFRRTQPDKPCPHCNGTCECAECNGRGRFVIPMLNGELDEPSFEVRCGACQGSGVCPWCQGAAERRPSEMAV